MNTLISIFPFTCFQVIFFLALYPISNAQEIQSARPEEPILWANSIQLAYGLSPNSLDLIQEAFRSTGVEAIELRKVIPALLESYYIERGADTSLDFGEFFQRSFGDSISDDLKLLRLSKNSPTLIAGSLAQVSYGINDTVFWALYEFLETTETKREEWSQKFGKLLFKYQQLEKDLTLRTDDSSKKALRLLKQGNIEGALELLKERYEFSVREVNRAKGEQALAAYDYGNVLILRFKYREANPVFKDAVTLQPTNYDYALAFATNLYELGDFLESINYSLSRVKTSENSSHPTENLNLSFLSILGNALLKLGRYKEASIHLQKLLELDREKYGEGHVHLARDYNNLGEVSRTLGKYSQAIDYYRLAIAIDKKNFVQDTLTISTFYNNLGLTFQKMAAFDSAEYYYSKSLEIDTLFLGNTHPRLATLYNNLGVLYQIIGEDTLAKICLDKALEINRKIFGEKHFINTTIRSNMVVLNSLKSQNTQSVETLKKAIKLDSIQYGFLYSGVSEKYNLLGLRYYHNKQPDKGRRYFEKALHIDTTLFGGNHTRVARMYNNLGEMYSEKGDFESAIPHFHTALRIDTVNFRISHPIVATYLNNLGNAYVELEEYASAINYLEKALAITSLFFKEQHPDRGITYNSLGLAYGKMGKHSTSLKYFSKALDVFEEIQPDNLDQFSTLYCNLRMAIIKSGKEGRGMVPLQKKLTRELLQTPKDKQKIALIYLNQGKVYLGWERYEASISSLLKAEEMFRNNFPVAYPQLFEVYKSLQDAYLFVGLELLGKKQYQEAISMFYESKSISKQIDDKENLCIAYNNIAAAYNCLENFDKASSFIQKGKDLITKNPSLNQWLKLLELKEYAMLKGQGKEEEAPQILDRLTKEAINNNDLEFLRRIEKAKSPCQ